MPNPCLMRSAQDKPRTEKQAWYRPFEQILCRASANLGRNQNNASTREGTSLASGRLELEVSCSRSGKHHLRSAHSTCELGYGESTAAQKWQNRAGEYSIRRDVRRCLNRLIPPTWVS